MPGDELSMASWVASNGPLSVSLDAMTQLWWPYTGGIMTGCEHALATNALACTRACECAHTLLRPLPLLGSVRRY